MVSLFGHDDAFSYLSFYYSEKVKNKESIRSIIPSITWQESSLHSIGWRDGTVIFLTKEEFRNIENIKKKAEVCFFLSFDRVPEEYQSYVFHIEENEEQKTFDLFLFFNGILKELKKSEREEVAFQDLEESIRRGQLYQKKKKNDIDEEYLKILGLFIKTDLSIFKSENRDDFLKKIEKDFSSLNLFHGLEIKKWEDIDQSDDSLSLPLFNKNEFLNLQTNDPKSPVLSFVCSLIFEWVERLVFVYQESGQKNRGLSLWEEAFSKTPIAAALISDDGELILHNSRFSKMDILPRECLNMKNGQKIEIKEDIYILNTHIIKEDLKENLKDESKIKSEKKVTMFLFSGENDFTTDQKQIKAVSGEELGIITSSIAHELNNPLAGILAAISLLELEDWSAESLQSINEMKESARRCKDLVEIFLGFSKVQGPIGKQSGPSGPALNAMTQSLDLLRFRMIESNLRLELELKDSGEDVFYRELNLSIIAMIFYLLLSEVLTEYAHLGLIRNDDVGVLKGYFKEEREMISINFAEAFHSDTTSTEKLGKSRLVRYLIDMERLSLEIKGGQILLTDWRLLA